MIILDYIGSAVIVVLLAMVIVSLLHVRRLQWKGVIGYSIVTIILLVMALRT